MDKNLKKYTSLFKNSTIISSSITLFLLLSAVVAAVLLGMRLYNNYTDLSIKTEEIDKAKTSVSLIQNNKNLLSQSIDDYNVILEKLVPNNESYFLVISALENLASRTGVRILSYSIDLSSSTEEKLTLQIEVEGDLSLIERFMQQYHFAGGRLITNESFSINLENQENITFSLNFFHKEFQDNVEAASLANPNDISEIQDIATKL
ncbi:hypothetical protein A3A93_04095 [Candidatus Roizmanbacteria bacterium RIFCSPLOWO2_01_FULL_38_12]|uniref:Uncharacterized protein n=1 Tax=Candidatus Roizmanbacteria bacterium RIFCSPLOWO2_01_FULL_38_12 TaxID=1802061 RepID=A0A1F7IUZ3_9BACT|nr:MAG: hypothetical protein A2861_00530 [Candidatus Roizmanbacteria bacterium RIFCSPHIGHO2_01_FULL_38_15]OGK35033.1 MAG: hypothetical protein A3F59_00270 [Candidatus Roizmanbacteria bacterium RIFCSPHIGHO2_12_FULL_38_13]OGK47188.1 MAG: hypothetical protein A3A93_04095 [Candidatus Roizmanbacteria bacterium RIFCSPLOWO2_01_FULL_38_12]